jgi:hypothetical protein
MFAGRVRAPRAAQEPSKLRRTKRAGRSESEPANQVGKKLDRLGEPE